MKDLIDKRNEEEKIRKSIIKRWNVNYVPQSAPPEGDAEAQRVLERLANEAALDETRKQDEIDQAMRKAAMDADGGLYNETTGSYSGKYGSAEMNDVTKGQIDKILHEKTEAIRHIVENKGE